MSVFVVVFIGIASETVFVTKSRLLNCRPSFFFRNVPTCREKELQIPSPGFRCSKGTENERKGSTSRDLERCRCAEALLFGARVPRRSIPAHLFPARLLCDRGACVWRKRLPSRFHRKKKKQKLSSVVCCLEQAVLLLSRPACVCGKNRYGIRPTRLNPLARRTPTQLKTLAGRIEQSRRHHFAAWVASLCVLLSTQLPLWFLVFSEQLQQIGIGARSFCFFFGCCAGVCVSVRRRFCWWW